MSDEQKSREQLIAELAEVRLERSRLLALVEKMHDESTRERRHHQDERTRLEGAAQTSRDDLAVSRTEAESGRLRMEAQVEQFKLDVDDKLKELAAYKLRSERIIENIPVGIAYLDRDLTTRWANPAFSHLVKLPFGEVVGRSFQNAFPNAEAQVSNLLREVIAKGQPNMPVKLPFVHSFEGLDQVTYWDLLALPLVGENQEVEGILVAIEVTDRVAREMVQREHVDKLVQLDRLKGDFISMVSHELRTPLSSIAGYAEFLEDNLSGPLTEGQREYVTAIQQAEQRIRAIVDDLLDFARLEAGTFKLDLEVLDLSELVKNELLVLLPQGTTAQVMPELNVRSAPLPVLGDSKRLGQVLLNLVGNAIKFTPAGGSVLVTVEAVGEDARVTVADSGIGIAPEALPLVFDKFFQVDPSSTREYGGAGLGLSISKMLIERQGGRIGVESEVNKGSSFWFTLPLHKDGIPAPALTQGT